MVGYDLVGQEGGSAGVLHRAAQRQHTADDDDGFPRDGAVGFVGGDAACDEDPERAQDDGDGQRDDVARRPAAVLRRRYRRR